MEKGGWQHLREKGSKRASQTIKTNLIFSSLRCFLPKHSLRDFWPDPDHPTRPNSTRQGPAWQGADTAVFHQSVGRSQVASCPLEEPIAVPLKLHSHCTAGTSCVENKQWDISSSWSCKACFLQIAPAFLFSHPGTLRVPFAHPSSSSPQQLPASRPQCLLQAAKR